MTKTSIDLNLRAALKYLTMIEKYYFLGARENSRLAREAIEAALEQLHHLSPLLDEKS